MRGKLVRPDLSFIPDQHNLVSFGSHGSQLSGFIEHAFYNGLGRYVCQLQRVTLKFCKFGGSSKGLRDYIENDVVDFSRTNPGVVVYLKPRRHKSPVMVCEYLNGTTHWMNLHKMSRTEISWWIDYYRTRSGEPVKRYRKYIQTDWPSVQGPWNPFLNMPTELNVSQIPNEERAMFRREVPSATERLLKMAEEGTLKNIIAVHPSDESKE